MLMTKSIFNSTMNSFKLLKKSRQSFKMVCQFKNCNNLQIYSANRFFQLGSKYQIGTVADDNAGRSVKDVERELIAKFSEGSVSEPEDSANFIIAHALGQKTLFSVQKSHLLNEHNLKEISKMVEDRLRHMPVQYVIKEWDFRDITLKMEPPVFIPRPETEELVEHMSKDPIVSSAKRFLEIGPGSGAICLSLLKEYPQLHCIAIEAGNAAASLTLNNAKSLGVVDRIDLLQIELDKDIQSITEFAKEQVDFIVSNPPYILTKDLSSLQAEIAMYEDVKALDGGLDGLCVIRNILKLAQHMLKKNGSLWMEVDSSHPELIQDIASRYHLKYCRTIKDFMQIDRFCHLTKM